MNGVLVADNVVNYDEKSFMETAEADGYKTFLTYFIILL
jgi:hypothetical protein